MKTTTTLKMGIALAFIVNGVPGSAALVVINEFLPNPSGSDGTAQSEWVELTNISASTVDLSGWTLERATDPGAWTSVFTVSNSTTIAPGEFLVIGEQNVTGADLTTISLLGLGNATTTGDAVRLRDQGGAVIDTVIYGPNNNDGFSNDTGVVASSVAPAPLADQSVARLFDGVDSDDSGVDFIVTSNPTIGGSNNSVPEPGTLLLLSGGMIALLRHQREGRQQNKTPQRGANDA